MGQQKYNRLLKQFAGSVILSFFTFWLTMRAFHYGARPVWKTLLCNAVLHLFLLVIGVLAVRLPGRRLRRHYFLYGNAWLSAYLIIPGAALFGILLLLTRSFELAPLFLAYCGFGLMSLAYYRFNKAAQDDLDVAAYIKSKRGKNRWTK